MMFAFYKNRYTNKHSDLERIAIDRDNLANRLRDQILQGVQMGKCLERVRNAWDEYVHTDDPASMIEAMQEVNSILENKFHA